MSTLLVFVFATIFGALHQEQIHYWLSRLVTVFRSNHPMVGDWELSYLQDEKEVTEQLHVYAAFADVSYGRLTATLRQRHGTDQKEPQHAEYRVRIEHCFDSIHAVTAKPGKWAHSDILTGLVRVDQESRTARSMVVGFSRERLADGEDIYFREASAVKA